VERQFDDKLGIVGMTGKQGKYCSSRTKAPNLFQLVRTSPLVAGPGVEAEGLLNSLKIRLSPTVSVERQFDDKLGIVGMMGKQGKYYFSRTKAPNLFHPPN